MGRKQVKIITSFNVSVDSLIGQIETWKDELDDIAQRLDSQAD